MHKNRHSKFLLGFLSAVICFLTFVSALNYLVDPAFLFREDTPIEKRIAYLLTKGHVGGVTNFDERLLQKYRLEDGIIHNLDYVILGSSRSMLIGNEVLTGKGINLSVSGASLEDFVALLMLADKYPVNDFILGLDPWVLNKNSGQSSWKSIGAEYEVGLAKLTPEEIRPKPRTPNFINWKKVIQLINAGYTHASYQSLRKKISGEVTPAPYLKPDDVPDANADAIRSDGTRIFNHKVESVTSDEAAEKALVYGLAQPIYSLGGFYDIDKERFDILRRLIKDLKGRGNVWILLPPYHPAAYKNLIQRVPIVASVERELRSLANIEHVSILGSYDPSRVGCTEEDFYDGMHPRAQCFDRMLNAQGVSTDAVRP